METFIKKERLRPVLFLLSGFLLAIIFFVWVRLIGHEVNISGVGQERGLKIGTVFPEFSLPDIAGRMVSSREYRGKNTLVMYVNPGCSLCKKLLPVVIDISKKESNKISLIIVSSGADSSNKVLTKEYKISCPVLRMDVKLFGQRYKVIGTPFICLVDRGGVIREKLEGFPPNVEKVLKKMVKKVS